MNNFIMGILVGIVLQGLWLTYWAARIEKKITENFIKQNNDKTTRN